jgi:hypothetical protein
MSTLRKLLDVAVEELWEVISPKLSVGDGMLKKTLAVMPADNCRVFMCQLPPTIIAIILVEWKLPIPQDEHTSTEDGRTKLKRIDWAGAIAMSLAILSTLLVIDMGGQKYDFSHPFIIISIIIAVVSTITFLVTEKFYAKEPIFPLHLLTHYVVVTSYMTLFLQTFAQTAVSVFVISPRLLVKSL